MKDQEIIDFGWDKIIEEFKDDEESYVDVGIVAKDGAETVEGGLTLVELAVIQEFGTDNIPSRPFIRQTFDKNLKEINKIVVQLDNEVMKGEITKKDALVKIGQIHQNQIQKAMSTKGEFEKNAPATIQKKGSDMPLIDTGKLRQSVNFEVG